MAISQARMLALINIADDFKSQLLSTNRAALDILKELPINPSPEELLSSLQAIQYLHTHVTLNPNAIETLANERAHFKLNSQRNTRQMLRARQKRGQNLEQPTPKQTAPLAIAVKKRNEESFYDKPQKFTGAAAPYSKVQVLSDEQLAQYMDIELAENKIKINKFCESVKMPAPYPDPYDDSIPLLPEHKRHLGLPVDDDDASPF